MKHSTTTRVSRSRQYRSSPLSHAHTVASTHVDERMYHLKWLVKLLRCCTYTTCIMLTDSARYLTALQTL
jgi:hypothetical protein